MSEQQPVTESKEVLGIKITHISGRKSNGGNIIPDVIRFGDGAELDKVYNVVKELGLGKICNAVVLFDDGKISSIVKSIDVWNKPSKGNNGVLSEVNQRRMNYLTKLEQAVEANDVTKIAIYQNMLKELDNISNSVGGGNPGKLKDSDSGRKVDSSVSEWTSNASDEDSNSPF